MRVGMTFAAAVVGESTHLIGSESLLEQYVLRECERLITRRGFKKLTNEPELIFRIQYRTDRDIRLTNESAGYSTTFLLNLGRSSSSGNGVAIANTVGHLLQSAPTIVSEDREWYSHTLAIEVQNSHGQLIWKGESAWSNLNVDIRRGTVEALQLLLSSLPKDVSIEPSVPKLKKSHFNNFFAEYCAEVHYACPALPYKIYFSVERELRGLIFKLDFTDDPSSLPAVVDLIQTAEYALPIGKKNIADPVDLSIWKKALLGGRYRLGSEAHSTPVMVELFGTASGYVVSRSWIASEADYTDFESRMDVWQRIVSNYFDMYEQ